MLTSCKKRNTDLQITKTKIIQVYVILKTTFLAPFEHTVSVYKQIKKWEFQMCLQVKKKSRNLRSGKSAQ